MVLVRVMAKKRKVGATYGGAFEKIASARDGQETKGGCHLWCQKRKVGATYGE